MNWKSIVSLHISLFICLLTFSGGHAQNEKKKYLFKLGEKRFYTDQFEYYFLKNSNDPDRDSVKIKVEEYLDLYIKFRLKVLEAKNLGMDQSEAFQKEFNGYKKQLAKPYLTESKMSEALVEETYNRLKYEINASHILLKVDEDAVPEDTLKAYNKLIGIKKRVEAGEDFESFAYEVSEDPSAKRNKGDLGYFSTMRMVYPFESVAYRTEVNEVSDPVRTKFGYHIIWVKKKRPARGKMKAAHIMIRIDQMGKQDPEQAKKKIESIYEKLENGEKWEELCKLYSEDFNTKNNGGELRWFGTGELIKEFEDATFALEKVNDYSTPIKTRFGWHIIKLLDKKPLAPLEEMRAELESKISRDSRSRQAKGRAINTLKEQYNYSIPEQNKNIALEAIDSTLLAGKWTIDSSALDNAQVLIKINDVTYSIGNFWVYVLDRQRNRNNISLDAYRDQLFSRFEEKCLLEFEEKALEQNNSEYKMLLEEYRSGILLFNLMEEKVWSFAAKDTTGLLEFYQRNKSEYTYPEKANVRIFSSSSKETIEQAKDYADKSKKEIDDGFNSQDPLHLQVADKTVSKEEDAIVAEYWQNGMHEFSRGGQHYLLIVKEIIPSGISPLDSVRGLVISDYQVELEEQWIKELMAKYPLKINKGVLNGFIKDIKQRS